MGQRDWDISRPQLRAQRPEESLSPISTRTHSLCRRCKRRKTTSPAHFPAIPERSADSGHPAALRLPKGRDLLVWPRSAGLRWRCRARHVITRRRARAGRGAAAAVTGRARRRGGAVLGAQPAPAAVPARAIKACAYLSSACVMGEVFFLWNILIHAKYKFSRCLCFRNGHWVFC